MGQKKAGMSKKCSSCSLDCTVVRGIAVANVPNSKKKDVLDRMFETGKPRYSLDTCPK